SGKLDRRQRGHRRVLERVAQESPQFVGRAVLVAGGRQALGPFQDRLRNECVLRELLHQPLIGAAGGGQSVGLLLRLNEERRQPLLAVAEFQERVGRLGRLRRG